MRTYILRRLLMFIPVMLAVYTLVFVVMHATPGGPWDNTERPLPPAVLKNLQDKYGLNEPLWKQYFSYLWGVVSRFDFGPSLPRNGVSRSGAIPGPTVTVRMEESATRDTDVATLVVGATRSCARAP